MADSKTDLLKAYIEANKKTLDKKLIELVNDALNEMAIDREDGHKNPKDEEEAKWLSEYNSKRVLHDKEPIKVYHCKICKARNSHLTKECPKIVCFFCKENHWSKVCPKKINCHYCNTTKHYDWECTSKDAINDRLKLRSWCYICRKYGHFPSQCEKPIHGISGGFPAASSSRSRGTYRGGMPLVPRYRGYKNSHK